MAGNRRAAVTAAFLAASGWASGFAASRCARADVASPPDATHHAYVELTVAASGEQTALLAATLRELVARLGLDLRVARTESNPAIALRAPSASNDERARVSIDETAADRVTIAVSAVHNGDVSTPVERTVARDASSAIVTEQVAHIVHSTLESLLAAEPLEPAPAPVNPTPAPPPRAIEPPPPPTPAIVEVPERPAPRGPSWWGNVHAAAAAYGTGRGIAPGAEAVLGAGGALGVTGWRGFGRPTLWLSGAYNAPFDEPNPDVTVRTTMTSVRGSVMLEMLAARLLGLDAGLGAGADIFHAVPGTASTGTSLAGTSDLVDPMVTARVIAGVRLVAGTRLVVGVDVDCDVATHRYVIQRATGDHSAVFQPWPVRPSALVGLCVPLAGALGCGE
jgi:hypothetical protein